MKIDKTAVLKDFYGNDVKEQNRLFTLGQGISIALSNQKDVRVFDPYKSFSLISKILDDKEKELDLDSADIDSIIRVLESNKVFELNDDWFRGQMIDLLKKMKTEPNS